MEKLNRLLLEWIKGTVGTSNYLNQKGYQKDLLKKYVKSGWLESLGYGAYKLSGDEVGWYGAVYALQKQKDSFIHPGAKTALAFKGYSHYLLQKSAGADLFGNPSDNLPKWFKDQSWMKNIRFASTGMMGYNKVDAFTEVKIDSILLKVSAPELAILEMLYLVPKHYTFDEANLIMESLTTLRGRLVQQLLENCTSIKVKRLFLYLAEKNRHPWFEELNLKKIDLGRGKRVIVKNGKLNKKYNITVPKL
ncbi:MAG: type IV toxin-antitoxin system AbiEi family antitoxin domain-containing protein [Ignavibacteriaceae bacterium]